jgi:HD-like signal output (HDOD) protein
MLRVVNSAFYRPAAGPRISTISRAVVTLGLESVSNLLMSIRVFEHFNGRKGIEGLKKSTVHALLTSVHARELARATGGVNSEEAFVAGMLHDLGMMLVAFHLPDEMATIEALLLKERLTPDAASLRVLGASFRQLGLGVADTYHLPQSVREGITGWTEGSPVGPSKIGALVSFGSDLSAALAIVDPKARAEQVAKLRARYAKVLPLGDKALEQVLKQSEARLEDLMSALRVTRKDLERYAPALFPHDARRKSRPGILAITAQPPPAGNQTARETAAPRPEPQVPHPEQRRGRADAELVRELEDISFALTTDVALEDVLSMILETVCRALPADGALLASIPAASDALTVRLALGERASLLRSAFRVSLLAASDPVSEAARDQLDLLVPSAKDDGRLSEASLGLPLPASLVFLPVVVRGALVGALYVERLGAPFGAVDLGPLRLLRNQAAMALRQG